MSATVQRLNGSPHSELAEMRILYIGGSISSTEKNLNALRTESFVVDAYAGYLRRKLNCGGLRDLIKTQRGVGYILEAPLDSSAAVKSEHVEEDG